MKATVKNLHGSGKVSKSEVSPQASTKMPDNPKKDAAAPDKMMDPAQAAAVDVAVPLVKSVHLSTYTPVTEGNYSGLHILPGTKLTIDLNVEAGAITSARVWFVPKPNVYGVADFDGVGIDPKGEVGELKVATGNLFTEAVANYFLPGKVKAYVGDSNNMPLDLSKLAEVVTTKLASMPKTKPDGPSMADVANAIQWKSTGGTVDAELTAQSDTTVGKATVVKGSSIFLHGVAGTGQGAKLSATADKVAVKMDGMSVDAAGVKTGTMDVSKGLNALKFTGLSIQQLDINIPTDKPVQKQSAGAALVEGDDVHRAAAHGVAGSASQLPNADAIQRSFGRHDVSGIQAHVGGAAADASRAIGAEAYASGDHVAFTSAPDLRLAAHEAAHVIQQQGGIQLSGGVGHSGDPFEQHADAVADAVVAGRSAESLLDDVAGGGGARTFVQRTDAPVAAAPVGPVDLKAMGIDVANPLHLPSPLLPAGPGVVGPPAPATISDDKLVTDWMTAHRADILITVSMPGLIQRIRRDLAPRSPSLVIASNEQILNLIHGGATALSLPLPKDELPMSYSADEVKAAASQGMSIDASFSITESNGRFNVVALGKTPDVPADGVQVVVDTSGAALNTKDKAGNSTSIQATTNMGVKFSTNIGPLAFTAGIDPNQWQVGLAFGPEVPQFRRAARHLPERAARGLDRRRQAQGRIAEPAVGALRLDQAAPPRDQGGDGRRAGRRRRQARAG